jgi:hypothetical protein
MSKKRTTLHEIFRNILQSDNVYFQPPESVKMSYPAIVYSRTNIRNTFADNSIYTDLIAYKVTVIDKNPESEIVGKIAKIPLCQFNQHFTSDNLNHDVFTLFY